MSILRPSILRPGSPTDLWRLRSALPGAVDWTSDSYPADQLGSLVAGGIVSGEPFLVRTYEVRQVNAADLLFPFDDELHVARKLSIRIQQGKVPVDDSLFANLNKGQDEISRRIEIYRKMIAGDWVCRFRTERNNRPV